MIAAENIHKRYGSQTILNGAGLRVGAGQLVVMTGGNGSGKTTLLHVLVGLRRPDEGVVRWKGETLTGRGDGTWREARESWGFMPQRVGMPPGATIRSLMDHHARLRGRDASQARAWLDRVGLAEFESRRVAELSGGMQQRLAIALTFFFDPELIIMDEPASNLDPGWRGALIDWASEYASRGRAVLVTSQLEESWGPDTVRLHCADGRITEVARGEEEA